MPSSAQDEVCIITDEVHRIMLSRRNLILATVAAVIAKPALAADASACAFVIGVYDAYKGKEAKGRPLEDARAIERYFTPSIAALMIKDRSAAARREDVGTLDFDPFVDAQDWDIGAFDIAVSDTAPRKTRATVRFTNAGSRKTVVLDLVNVKNEWRIDDITWQRHGKRDTLRGLFVSK